MAFDPNAPDPNAQNQPAVQPLTPPMTSSAPGGGPAAPAAGKGTAPQATPSQPFQNLNAYLTANAPQVSQEANKVAGDLNNQYGQVQSDIANNASNFAGQVQSGYAAPNSATTTAAAANPTEFASDPNNVAAFQALYNDTYQGPANYESTASYGTLNNEVNTATNNAALLGTTSGLENYFQTQNPNATQGGNTLDAVLLQGNPEAQQTMANATKPFSTLADQLAGFVTTADQGVTAAENAAQNEAQAVQQQFTGPGGVVPTFQGNVNNELASNQALVDAYNQKLNNLIGKETNPDYTNLQSDVGAYNSALGDEQNGAIIPNGIKGLPGLTLPALQNPAQMGAPTLAQSATPQDIAEQNALETLLGSTYSPLFDTTGTTPFQAPGNVPTLHQEFNPIIDNLIAQLGSNTARNAAVPGQYANVNKDISSLENWLGFVANQ